MYFILIFILCSLGFAADPEVKPKDEGLNKKVTVLNVTKRPKVRLKDIIQIQGVRPNYLVGYGLVVGLSGSGDSGMGSPNTRESLISMLERSGVNVREYASKFMGKSVASVMVTATLPSFARQGTTIDVTVSALGDAKDLKGGTLIVTSLMGADGDVYAVAQGTIMTSAISAQGRAASVTRGVPTSGKIPGGGIVEKEVGFEFKDLPNHRLLLNNPDLTTARRIAQAINKNFPSTAKTLDPTTIQLSLPKGREPLQFFTDIESLSVEPDQKARIVIDQNEGVIVISDRVTINPSAVMHGSITVRVMEVPQAIPQTIVMPPVLYPGMPVRGVDGNPASPVQGMLDLQKSDLDLLSKQQQQQLGALTSKQTNDTQTFNTYNPSATAADLERFRQQQEKEKEQLLSNQRLQMSGALETHRKALSATQETSNPSTIINPMASLNISPTVIDNTKINVQEEKGLFATVGGVNLEEVVNALNEIGASVKVISAILHNLKASGAIQAEIVVI